MSVLIEDHIVILAVRVDENGLERRMPGSPSTIWGPCTKRSCNTLKPMRLALRLVIEVVVRLVVDALRAPELNLLRFLHGRRRLERPIHGVGSPPRCRPPSRRRPAGSRRSQSRRETGPARRCSAPPPPPRRAQRLSRASPPQRLPRTPQFLPLLVVYPSASAMSRAVGRFGFAGLVSLLASSSASGSLAFPFPLSCPLSFPNAVSVRPLCFVRERPPHRTRTRKNARLGCF